MNYLSLNLFSENVINSEWIRQKECVISERVAEIKRERRAEGEKVTAASAGIKGSSRALRDDRFISRVWLI